MVINSLAVTEVTADMEEDIILNSLTEVIMAVTVAVEAVTEVILLHPRI